LHGTQLAARIDVNRGGKRGSLIEDAANITARSASRARQVVADADGVTFAAGTRNVVADVNVS
jgi:hypothetical protein